jgi:Fe2+ or Zn2+ uptake regulation protein
MPGAVRTRRSPRPTRPPRRIRSRTAANATMVPEPSSSHPESLEVLSEPPHAHIVCRSCGRIAEVPLDTEAKLRLEELARARPSGWSVDLIAYSLTGACSRCREGPSSTG